MESYNTTTDDEDLICPSLTRKGKINVIKITRKVFA